MKVLIRAAVLCLALTACAGANTKAARLDATDLPESFVVLEAGGGTHPVDPAPACENPLADPRDGTKLTLERADNGFGDYALSTARYGLAAGELLSIDCRTGVARGH